MSSLQFWSHWGSQTHKSLNSSPPRPSIIPCWHPGQLAILRVNNSVFSTLWAPACCEPWFLFPCLPPTQDPLAVSAVQAGDWAVGLDTRAITVSAHRSFLAPSSWRVRTDWPQSFVPAPSLCSPEDWVIVSHPVPSHTDFTPHWKQMREVEVSVPSLSHFCFSSGSHLNPCASLNSSQGFSSQTWTVVVTTLCVKRYFQGTSGQLRTQATTFEKVSYGHDYDGGIWECMWRVLYEDSHLLQGKWDGQGFELPVRARATECMLSWTH